MTRGTDNSAIPRLNSLLPITLVRTSRDEEIEFKLKNNRRYTRCREKTAAESLTC